MNVVFGERPALVYEVNREYYGIDGAICIIRFACGHYWGGLTREAPETPMHECWQCVATITDVPEHYNQGVTA
jgi:hypothetical protein